MALWLCSVNVNIERELHYCIQVLECVEDVSEGLQWVSEQIQTILKKVCT